MSRLEGKEAIEAGVMSKCDVVACVMKFEKETKNTLRYQEEKYEDGTPDIIGTLYVQKTAFEEGYQPEEIVIEMHFAPKSFAEKKK